MEDINWKGKEVEVNFTIDGADMGYGFINITPDGVYDTDDVEEAFGKMLRKQEKHLREEAEEEEKEFIVDNLTKEQEDKLKDFHADQCEGVLDDDMPDDYEDWLMELDIDTLKGYLKEI